MGVSSVLLTVTKTGLLGTNRYMRGVSCHIEISIRCKGRALKLS